MNGGPPTWAAGPTVVRVPAADGSRRPPVTLLAATAGVVALVAVEAGHIAGRDDLRPALRGALVAVVALQLPAAWLALRRSSTGAMVLLLCGLSAVVAGLAGGGTVLAAVGAAVVVLVARSLRWFPAAELRT